MLTGRHIRAALSLLGWEPQTLAGSAMLTFDVIAMAQDDITIRHLGGLQLGAIKQALEAGGVEFIAKDGGGVGVRLRKGVV